MNRTSCLTLVAFASVLSFVPGVTAGPTVPHRESGDGQLTNVVQPPGPPPAVGLMEFVGRGKATHMGLYNIVGKHNFTSTGQVLNGGFTSTAADGSTISGTY